MTPHIILILTMTRELFRSFNWTNPPVSYSLVKLKDVIVNIDFRTVNRTSTGDFTFT